MWILSTGMTLRLKYHYKTPRAPQQEIMITHGCVDLLSFRVDAISMLMQLGPFSVYIYIYINFFWCHGELPRFVTNAVIEMIMKPQYLIFCPIGLVGRVFANGLGDRGSIPGCVVQKTLKMVLDTSLLNTQQYKVCIKGKVKQSR